jgi:hypothetical protein
MRSARSAGYGAGRGGREQSRVRHRGPNTATRSCRQRAHDRGNPLTFRSRHAGRIWPRRERLDEGDDWVHAETSKPSRRYGQAATQACRPRGGSAGAAPGGAAQVG